MRRDETRMELYDAIEAHKRTSNGDNGEAPSRSSSVVFSEIKSCCLELLDLLQNPKNQSPALSHLLHLLRSSHPQSIQHLFDYILFPLLLLLDAAVGCRSLQKCDSDSKFRISVNQTPNKVSDAVAEAVLQCLEELLRKCYIGSVNQITVVLKKLTHGAMLSPSEASEEFREGVVRCFRSLLSNLTPCRDTSCSCRYSLDKPALLEIRYSKDFPIRNSEHDSETKECLLAFIQSESTSTAVGHWLSLLLNIADDEGRRGLRGSAKLRVEALFTMRLLVAKVGSSDALAFFLPGVVSQLAKIMHISKSMISGAAGSTEATDHAIKGLAEIITAVLQDDANVSGLNVLINSVPGSISHENGSLQSFVEELRHLNVKAQSPLTSIPDSTGEIISAKVDPGEKQSPNIGGKAGSLWVERSPDWIKQTSVNIDKLLSMTFPHICVHPSKRIRLGLLSAIKVLLSKCSHTLKESRMMLLECLCTFVCDDCEEVSVAAQEFLEFMLSSHEKQTIDGDVAEIFQRLLEKLPKMVLGSEESLGLAHAQQMLAVIYYSGPELVVDQLLRSPIKAAKLFDVFALCLSQESVFAGSLGYLLSSRPSGTGYLHSLAELRAGSRIALGEQGAIRSIASEVPNMSTLIKEMQHNKEYACKDYNLPRMPPWFALVGSHKLYQVLADILRLVGLSLIADRRTEVSLSQIFEIPLSYLRNLVSEIRRKEYSKESWESWNCRIRSGQLLRQASTAACILNEMIYGMSDQAFHSFRKAFHKSRMELTDEGDSNATTLLHNGEAGANVHYKSPWKVSQGPCLRQHVIDCVGTILHEYLTPEVWDLPVNYDTSLLRSGANTEDLKKHFFNDVAMLHQVLIQGVGVFNLCLGKDFVASGFLCSSLYLLLENLICSNSEVRQTADAVLSVISATSGYPTVGHLVVANSDYVIDSLCHQLRHLDLNPHVPGVLSAMLSFVGVANKILPLLEEPMRCVSMELEILGRRQHPELTIPFLKAVAEIAKAARQEALVLPAQAKAYKEQVNDKICNVKHRVEKDNTIQGEPDEEGNDCVNIEEWENVLAKLNDNKRYRRVVASITSSCLTAVTPLLASEEAPACLITLQIIEDGVTALAKVEEAFRHEKETKEGIEELASLCSFYHLKDILDASEETPDENRLLPAVNKIWPFLVTCVRNRLPVPILRCLNVISTIVKTCGGDFFSRRFHTDGSHFWKLLTTSPFKKRAISKDDKTPLLLPYRNTSRTSEDPLSESSTLKIQAATLHMIFEIAREKRSASAFRMVLKKVSGLVVGIACSRVSGLHDASFGALSGLSSIDPDLIWVLLADVYYSLRNINTNNNNREINPPNTEFPQLVEILPPPVSSKSYMFVQYGGQTYGFDIDFSSVETVFKKLFPEEFNFQKY